MPHENRQTTVDRSAETRAIAEAIDDLSAALERLEASVARIAATRARRRPARPLDRAA